ncbi:hypothetical protein TPHA_0M01620 [Tetrapisispora phaffii CBS 4417]|uniref:Transcription and mRNA export factor SUS1 n=1 Tax=Tetrapisispora phaffii (strain ATCC 24235 / CBS 4417 / NBRC 1672 / NRRL Y-8282 / UCD 70-5) TaxID=1071381 RepID=G8C0M2_TETPH|nr:hypothetical protein TPHA_0M01620 [Tetrapisispora phaffii CBS 4417]CCE65737.1 hypothetical protein TPHA_0M01620 [Tetrapisispora phaffii CBS 4417]
MTTDANNNLVNLKAQIQQYLVESGNYEKISNDLNKRLLAEGWMESVKKLTLDEINVNDSTKFPQILKNVEPEAINMVSDTTKNEVIEQIKFFLNEVFNTEQ